MIKTPWKWARFNHIAAEYEVDNGGLYENGHWQLVRKWTERYRGIMEHYHVWLSELVAGRPALLMLLPRFQYRNAARRSAPPGSTYRVFVCRNPSCGG